jgi:uncharacterized protein
MGLFEPDGGYRDRDGEAHLNPQTSYHFQTAFQGHFMTHISMYRASIPAFKQTLGALSGSLGKAAAHAADKKFDPSILVQSRLAPDMFALARQVQISADFAKGCASRLAGVEAPKFADDETTLEQLQARIAKTIDFLDTLIPEQIDGSEEREITLNVGPNTMTFPGLSYLVNFVMPNFYFHASMAYAILRHNGVEVGKGDFMGQPR